jgi:xanthine dehydrogenase accessory factor
LAAREASGKFATAARLWPEPPRIDVLALDARTHGRKSTPSRRGSWVLGSSPSKSKEAASGALARTIIDRSDSGLPLVRITPDGTLLETFARSSRPLDLFGAGHVGRALVLALAPLPFDVVWIDPRREAFPGAMPANVRAVHLPDPAAALAGAPADAFVLVMTHSHPLDLEIVHAALAAERWPYVGLIGSATKRARFAKRLRAWGLSVDAVARLVCPIGLAGIASKSPAAIAASVAADLLIRHEAETSRKEAVAPMAERA